MISPLQLSNYFVTELSYRSNPAYGADAQVRNEGKINCTVEFGRALDAPDYFKVVLGITVEPSPESTALDPYFIDMKIEGYFSFQPDTDVPQSEKERMVSLNGCAILMGLARGLVAQATGVSQFGKYLLPPVNFVEILKGLKTGTAESVDTAHV